MLRRAPTAMTIRNTLLFRTGLLLLAAEILRQKIRLLPPLQFRLVALLIIDKARGDLLVRRRPAPMLPAGPVDVGLPLISLVVHRLPSCLGLRGVTFDHAGLVSNHLRAFRALLACY